MTLTPDCVLHTIWGLPGGHFVTDLHSVERHDEVPRDAQGGCSGPCTPAGIDAAAALSLECATLSAELDDIVKAMESSSRLDEARAEGAADVNLTHNERNYVSQSITLPSLWVPFFLHNKNYPFHLAGLIFRTNLITTFIYQHRPLSLMLLPPIVSK
jgi:hypothetical protein